MNEEPVTPTIYKDYKIFHMGDGFNHTFLFEGHSLYLVTSFTATKDDSLGYSFTFGYSSIGAATSESHIDREDLINQALEVVKAKIDDGNLVDRNTYFFEYEFNGSNNHFKEVSSPVWSSTHFI